MRRCELTHTSRIGTIPPAGHVVAPAGNTSSMSGLPRIALAQINPTVGDLDGNAALITDWADKARRAGAELVIFPELSLPGYPAEDLYLRGDFVRANVETLTELAARIDGITALVGFADPVADPVGSAIAANAVASISAASSSSTLRLARTKSGRR